MYCRACRHYYVTWDRHHPHGCRAMGFKSRSLPSSVVRSAMQERMECLLFLKRAKKRNDPESSTRINRII